MLLSQRPHAVFKAAVHSGPSSGLPSCIPHRPSRVAGRRQRYLCSLSFYNAPGAHIPAASYAVHSLKQLRSTGELLRHCRTVRQGTDPGGYSSHAQISLNFLAEAWPLIHSDAVQMSGQLIRTRSSILSRCAQCERHSSSAGGALSAFERLAVDVK
jgi:hypothetical protein